MFESCEYSDIYEYMWTKKLPYLGTIASLCNFNNLVSGMYNDAIRLISSSIYVGALGLLSLLCW